MRRRAELLYPKLLFSCADFPGNTGQIARAEQGGRSCFAKRMECVELAPAFEPRHTSDSGSKLHALHTLRETRAPLSSVCAICSVSPENLRKKARFSPILFSTAPLRQRPARNGYLGFFTSSGGFLLRAFRTSSMARSNCGSPPLAMSE